MSHSWLLRQRKQALLDLSEEAGHPQDEDLRKDDIVDSLHSYLQQNSTRLARNPTFEGYYGVRRGSPVKRRQSTNPQVSAAQDDVEEVKSVVRGRGRRGTTVKSEPEDSDAVSSPVQSIKAASSTALARTSSAINQASSSVTKAISSATPAASRAPATRRRSTIPGPPSPTQLADAVEQETNGLWTSVSDLYARSGVVELIDSTRESCSTVTAVQLTFLLLEAFAVQRALLPWDLDILSTSTRSTPIYLPNLYNILTGHYWAVSSLWVTTSVLIPSLFAYFYNFTLRDVGRGFSRLSNRTDPFTFNIVKALVTYIVYGYRGNGYFTKPFAPVALIPSETIDTINGAVFGGYRGILVGCAVGVLASLYEAALEK